MWNAEFSIYFSIHICSIQHCQELSCPVPIRQRRHHRVRCWWRHGHEGAGRPRRAGAAHGSRADDHAADFKTMEAPSRRRGIAGLATRRRCTRRPGRAVIAPTPATREHHRRAVHRRTGQSVPAVPVACHRRPHQPLRARPAPVLGLRLQTEVDERCRLGCRSLRESGAVLRQSRTAHRRDRQAEGLRSAPDGNSQTPAPFKPHEHLVFRACAKLGIKATSSRRPSSRARSRRPACVYCGQCGRGCRSGRTTRRARADLPSHGDGPRNGWPTRWRVSSWRTPRERHGRLYIGKTTGEERQVRCRTVVLSAAACESARLLLNSKSSRHPNGLANASASPRPPSSRKQSPPRSSTKDPR